MATIGEDLSVGYQTGTGTGIQNLSGFTDLKNLASPDKVAGLSTDLKGMASKMNDLGAKFKDSESAKALMTSMENPAAPNYNQAFSSLNDMMTQFGSDFEGMTGTGTGGLGLPKMQDFTEAVSGGPSITALLNGSVDASSIASINSMVSKATSLFSTAGIDIDTPPAAPKLGDLLKAATSLHKIGAEANGTGSADVIKNMLPSGSAFGDSIKVAMAEGKNMKAMAAAGIKPPVYNPFEGLPAGGDADLSTASAQKLLGG